MMRMSPPSTRAGAPSSPLNLPRRSPSVPRSLRTVVASPTGGSFSEHGFSFFRRSAEALVIGPNEAHVTTPHVQAKYLRRRAEILRAALGAFRERGYHATTLDSIAEQLGVRKTALYHYFPDKPAILLACHRESIADLERITAVARQLGTERDRLRYIIVEHVRVMTDAFGTSPLAFEVGPLTPERQAEIVASRDRYERELRDVIQAGMRAGTFRAGDPKLAAFLVLGALNGIARWYRPGGSLNAGALGEQFASQLIDGLASVPAPTAVAAADRAQETCGSKPTPTHDDASPQPGTVNTPRSPRPALAHARAGRTPRKGTR